MCRWDVDHVQVLYWVAFSGDKEGTIFIGDLHSIVVKVDGTASVAETGDGDQGDGNVRELVAVPCMERKFREGKGIRGNCLHVRPICTTDSDSVWHWLMICTLIRSWHEMIGCAGVYCATDGVRVLVKDCVREF